MEREQVNEKSLLDVEEGKEVRVKKVLGGRGIRCRLEGLGIYPGQTLKVLKSGWGPVLVEVYGRKIGLGRGQAAKILVEEDKIATDGGNPFGATTDGEAASDT